MTAIVTLTSIQDAYIARLHEIEAVGVGEHKRRSRGAAYCRIYRALEELGYDEAAIRQSIRDAVDMFELERNADE